VWCPSSAEYWHRREGMMRFWRVRERTVRGWKSLGIGAPDGWALNAVPEGGFWVGVK